MKTKSIVIVVTLLIMAIVISCSTRPVQGNTVFSETVLPLSESLPQEDKSSPISAPPQIYLYGEQHGVENILDKEIELWNGYYHNENMRHLFVELPYYTAEFLNIWMKSDNDEILDAIYDDWSGSAAHNPDVKMFYQAIKKQCPKTIFHGTDVGHQYSSTGVRYLNYLKANKQEHSESFRLANEAIEQGKYYYEQSDEDYRENMMAENFFREFDKLKSESIMGIYGSAHTGLDSLNFSGTIPCMANQLKKKYGDNIHSEDLILLY